MSMRVIRPGLLTTIQDLGRYGLQRHGVIVSGAMDSVALRMANLLVGNAEDEGALELTLIGPMLEFDRDSLIAICGAGLNPSIGEHSIPECRPVFVRAGSRLQFGTASRGCRAYVAIAGGFDVSQVMGSKSTYLRAGIGGYEGRALREGDVLQLCAPSASSERLLRELSSTAPCGPFLSVEWALGSDIVPPITANPVIRVMEGGQFNWFDAASQSQFFSGEFQVTPQSDRMGYRLSGPKLALTEPQELISEAVTAGTIQVPSNGDPIILLADRQTTGGYPKIGQVISVDLPVIAQVRPGQKIRFQQVSLGQAQELYRQREIEIQLLKQGVSLKM